MSSESSDTPDPQSQLEEMRVRYNELKEHHRDAGVTLELTSNLIDGWHHAGGDTVAHNIKAMADVLIDAIKKRDARIQRLQLKLGQLVERGPGT